MNYRIKYDSYPIKSIIDTEERILVLSDDINEIYLLIGCFPIELNDVLKDMKSYL